jgi:hypothetical protein
MRTLKRDAWMCRHFYCSILKYTTGPRKWQKIVLETSLNSPWNSIYLTLYVESFAKNLKVFNELIKIVNKFDFERLRFGHPAKHKSRMPYSWNGMRSYTQQYNKVIFSYYKIKSDFVSLSSLFFNQAMPRIAWKNLILASLTP